MALAVEKMTQVLLAGSDWKFRALLRAQLIEEGLNVEAHEKVGDAIQTLSGPENLPGLFVADLSSSADPAGDAGELAKWAGKIPTWIIVSRTMNNLEGRGLEMILYLPVDMGRLVTEIKRRLGR